MPRGKSNWPPAQANTKTARAKVKAKSKRRVKQSHKQLSQQLSSLSTWEHDLDLIQMFLHAAVSCICLSRLRFDEQCFDRHLYYRDGFRTSYNAITTLEKETGTLHTDGNGAYFLKRGINSSADMVLDWIQIGVFSVLARKKLNALQLRIFEDEDHPESAVESYTFTIEERRNQVMVQTQSESQHTVNTAVSQVSLQHAITDLHSFFWSQPGLPASRHIALVISLSDTAVDTIDPVGFLDCAPPNLRVSNNDLWHRRFVKSATFDTVTAAVHLQISHLTYHGPQDSQAPQIPTKLPDSLAYTLNSHLRAVEPIPIEPTLELSQSRDYDHLDEEETVTECSEGTLDLDAGVRYSEASETSARNVVCNTPSQSVNFQGTSTQSQSYRLHQLTHGFRPIIPSSQPSTQVVSQLPTRLQSSLPTPEPSQVSTQILSQLHPGLHASPATPGKSQASIQLESQLHPGFHTSGPTISQTQPVRYKQSTWARLTGGRQKSMRLPAWDKNAEKIKCHCTGTSKEVGNMVQCYSCNAWQHLVCFGFLDHLDERRPTTWACYACLNNKPNCRNGSVVDFAIKRRLLALSSKRPIICEDFAAISGIDAERVQSCADELITNDVLQANMSRGVAVLVATDDEQNMMTIRRAFFDPALYMSRFIQPSQNM